MTWRAIQPRAAREPRPADGRSVVHPPARVFSDLETVFLLERAERTICSSCCALEQLEPFRLADRGTLYVYSIVHRSFPGVETPYISAVVDLENGGTVKGNLIGVEPVPEKINMGMPVEVVYKIAPQKDREGTEYMAYYFQPVN